MNQFDVIEYMDENGIAAIRLAPGPDGVELQQYLTDGRTIVTRVAWLTTEPAAAPAAKRKPAARSKPAAAPAARRSPVIHPTMKKPPSKRA